MARRLVRPGQPSHNPELGHGRGRASRRAFRGDPWKSGGRGMDLGQKAALQSNYADVLHINKSG
jgi:hypothetical protein